MSFCWCFCFVVDMYFLTFFFFFSSRRLHTSSFGDWSSDVCSSDLVTSKGALKMLTRALAVEVAPFNVQVNGIAPGFFRTDMNAALAADPAFSAWVERRTPAGRWGDPAAVAAAAVFLASPAS